MGQACCASRKELEKEPVSTQNTMPDTEPSYSTVGRLKGLSSEVQINSGSFQPLNNLSIGQVYKKHKNRMTCNRCHNTP